MKQLLKILHRLSYLFVIPILGIVLMFYLIGRLIYNAFYWILTGKSYFGFKDIIIEIIIDWKINK